MHAYQVISTSYLSSVHVHGCKRFGKLNSVYSITCLHLLYVILYILICISDKHP